MYVFCSVVVVGIHSIQTNFYTEYQPNNGMKDPFRFQGQPFLPILDLSALSFLCFIYFEFVCPTHFIRLHSELRSIFIPQMSQFRISFRHPCLVLTPFSETCVQLQNITLCLRPYTTEVLQLCLDAAYILVHFFYRCTVQAESDITHI